MSRVCLVCFRSLPDGAVGEYHGRCAKLLFGSKTVPTLAVDPRNLHLLGLEMAGRVSLSGVQKKIALRRDRSTLRVVGDAGGEYILKPQTEEYPDLPQNEQLCLRIAQAVGLRTAASGLVRLPDGSLALLSRRFDRRDGHRLPMEDFCQLGEKLPREKYRGSYEQCVELLQRHSDGGLADAAELFRLVLFSWWIGNNDLHLKNIALLGDEAGLRLSPCYDLVSTAILGLEDRLALTIAGRHSKVRFEDWIELGERAGLSRRAILREVERLWGGYAEGIQLLAHAPLRADLVVRLIRLLTERVAHVIALGEHAVSVTEKPTQALSAPYAPTGRTAREVYRKIVDGLEHLNVAVGPGLAAELTELEWLAKHEGPLFATEGGALAEDRDRTIRAFLRLDKLRWTARVLERVESIPGSRNAIKRLGATSIAPSGAVGGQAGDPLFELEVAAALEVSGHFDLRMGATDIEIIDPSGAVIGIECKRPRTERSLTRCVREAAKQLSSRGRAGFIVISLSEMLDTHWIEAAEPAKALREVRTHLQSVVRQHEGDLARFFTPSEAPEDFRPGFVLGAILALDVVLFTRAETLGGFVVRAHTVTEACVNPHHPELHVLVEFIANAITLGADEFQR